MNGEISKIEKTISRCLRYRRLSITTIVGRDGDDAPSVPDYYPTEGEDLKVIDGILGNGYIQSPVTVGATEFDDIYYEGFTLPSTDRSLLPWMGGNLRYDDDNSLVASAMSPRELEMEGFKTVHGIDNIGFDYVRYVDPPVYIESNSTWLARSDEGKAFAANYFPIDSGLWIIRSQNNNDLDKKDKQCLRYGDAIFLQHNETKDFLGIITNFALGKPTDQSSTYFTGFGSSNAVNGNTGGRVTHTSVSSRGGRVTHTSVSSTNPTWSVDLKATININKVIIYNRSDCCQERLSGFKLIIWRDDDQVHTYTYPNETPKHKTEIDVPDGVIGNKVEIMLPGSNKILSLAEVEVYGELKPARFKVKSRDGNDGSCVQMLSRTYLEFIDDYSKKILVSGLSPNNKIEVKVQAESDIGDNVDPQWVFRKDDERIDGFSCGALSPAHGQWISLNKTNNETKVVDYEVGISGRSDCKNITFTTMTKTEHKDSWSKGPFEIVGYGEVPRSCHYTLGKIKFLFLNCGFSSC